MKITQLFLFGSSISATFSTRGSMRNFGLSVSKKKMIYIIFLYKKKTIIVSYLSYCQKLNYRALESFFPKKYISIERVQARSALIPSQPSSR